MKLHYILLSLALFTFTMEANAQDLDCSKHASGVATAIAKSLGGNSSTVKYIGTKDGENFQYTSVISYATKESTEESVYMKIVFNYYGEAAPSAGCALTGIKTEM